MASDFRLGELYSSVEREAIASLDAQIEKTLEGVVDSAGLGAAREKVMRALWDLSRTASALQCPPERHILDRVAHTWVLFETSDRVTASEGVVETRVRVRRYFCSRCLAKHEETDNIDAKG